MGAYGNWYIIDKDDKIVGHASTGEQALMTMLRMNGKPHDRFQTLWEQEVSKVVDTRGGVPCVVKTCKTLQEARAEADRLNKENQQLR
jgi:uncharacterized protein (DUF2252 family)